MSNPLKAFTRAFTPPGTGAFEAQLEQSQIDAQRVQQQLATAQEQQTAQLAKQTEALQEQTAIAKQSAADALDAQQKAARDAAAAATPAADSESARRASEARMRQLLAAVNPTSAPRFFGQPPIGYRALTGT